MGSRIGRGREGADRQTGVVFIMLQPTGKWDRLAPDSINRTFVLLTPLKALVDNFAMQKNVRKSTATQILDIAQNLLQSRGYSAFSYADISDQVGIRKASIHYHFPSKEDLVRRLIQYHRQGLSQSCDRILHSHQQPSDRLLQFVNLYRTELQHHQICLGGMLAADFNTLSAPLQTELREFFQQRETWLAQVLEAGEAAQLWHCKPTVAADTKGLLSLLQGAQLLARTEPDPPIAFDLTVYPLLQAKYHIMAL